MRVLNPNSTKWVLRQSIHGFELNKLRSDTNHRPLTHGIRTHFGIWKNIYRVVMYYVSFHLSHCLGYITSRATWDGINAENKPINLLWVASGPMCTV